MRASRGAGGDRRIVALTLALAVVTAPPLLCGPAVTWGVVNVEAAVSTGERSALVDLYLATSGPTTWLSKGGWSSYASVSSDPCASTWAGVSCSYLPDRITYGGVIVV